MTESQFSPEQERGMSDAREAMRELPQKMDRQAYLTLEQHTKSLQERLDLMRRFVRDRGLEADLMHWCLEHEVVV